MVGRTSALAQAPRSPRRPSRWALAVDMLRAQRGGAPALRQRADVRLRRLVAHARAHSPLLADLYAGVPRGEPELADLPATSKRALMADFDSWVTDPAITRAGVAEFVAQTTAVGRPLGPAALVCTSSGTTGLPGLYVHGAAAVDLYWVNPIVRGYGTWFGPATLVEFLRRGGREAQVIGTRSHFGGAAWAHMARRQGEMARKAMAVFAVEDALPDLVAELNAFDPAVLAGYSTSLLQLAAEQRAGRLRIAPVLVVTSGEGITGVAQAALAEAFGGMVRQSYAASETLFMAHSCAEGWLHLSNDWYLLEPVEADGSPTPAGRPSHTVLVTNLANWLQPVIRYDLGDSVLMRPEPCACGSALPAFRVAGRSGELLVFHDGHGREVSVSPMLIGTALDSVPGAVRSQLLQLSPTSVALRFEVPGPAAGQGDARARVGEALHREVAQRLTTSGLANVSVRIDDEPPIHASPKAKFQRVLRL